MTSPFHDRWRTALEDRKSRGLHRSLRIWETAPGWLNLADNDYLNLARDPALVTAAIDAAGRYGCSSSASPLISGYGPAHRELEETLCRWHGFPHGLVWNSGYAANHAILSRLPRPGDLVLADRLIHHSMVSGILQSGARLIRYAHDDLDHLERLLEKHAGENRAIFVVTESLFSMDGDFPDLRRLATLKKQFPFFLIVDEAHATGWYGPRGAGLVAEAGLTEEVDVLVGTLGKALGSQGAYTLFHDPLVRDFLINEAGEFIFSTYLSPIAAAVAQTAIARATELALEQPDWHELSRQLRQRLRVGGWQVADGDSPIVPVQIGEAEAAVKLAAALRERKILVGAVRPPTVPAGSSRLRISLKRDLTLADLERLVDALEDACYG